MFLEDESNIAADLLVIASLNGSFSPDRGYIYEWERDCFQAFLVAFIVIILAEGLAALVTKFSRSGGVFLDAAFLSAPALLLVEAAFIRRRHHEEMEERRFRGLGPEPVPLIRDASPTRLEVALILVGVVGLLSLLHLGSQHPPPPDQIQSLTARN